MCKCFIFPFQTANSYLKSCIPPLSQNLSTCVSIFSSTINEQNLPNKRMNCLWRQPLDCIVWCPIKWRSVWYMAPLYWEKLTNRSIWNNAIVFYQHADLSLWNLCNNVLKNFLAKIARTSGLILQKRELSCKYCPGIYGFMTGWLSFWCFEIAFISWCVLIDTSLLWLWKFFLNLGTQHRFTDVPFVSSRTGDLLRTTPGKVWCVFLVNYQSEN